MIDAGYYMPVLAYLLGSIPMGWILAKLMFKTDIRAKGSGNIGATNALRQFGTKVGVLVLILDMIKGIVSVLLAKSLLGLDNVMVPICGLIAILGHIYPVWLGFKGGKGVATAAGVGLALAPLSIPLALAVFILVVYKTRYVSLGSIIAAIVWGLSLIYFAYQSAMANWGIMAAVVVVVVAVIIGKHKQNIQRLRNGTENKISFTKKGQH
ncbi:MAG TPA: glycerol-3-phosphate 1-O-acyltransferase PlsY [Candidatus Cloacimonadota bacterium]|jgi:glycerol-3-phosphate acyltransferase PlsY|nr:glycerol-3-phosphate 1-O-acyltransferase PlsY [Candidatus Cloacimonadota bacterium]